MSATVIAPVVVKTVLFATDFSPASQTALPYASALAQRYGARVVLLHVLPDRLREPIPMDSGGVQIDFDRHDAERKLLRLEHRPELEGVAREVVLRRGELWPACADVINTYLVDLVVVGTRGRGGLMKLLLGSGAEEILRHSRVPVLCVGPDVPQREPGPPRNLVYATNYSGASEAALRFALSLANDRRCRLTLLHVIEEIEGVLRLPEPERLLRAEEQRLQSLPPADFPAQVNAITRFGLAAEIILETAHEERADMIVMGAHKTAAVAAATHLPWSVAHTVVAHAPCPVLMVGA